MYTTYILTPFNEQCTLYTVQCTLYSVHCTLYCIVYINNSPAI